MPRSPRAVHGVVLVVALLLAGLVVHVPRAVAQPGLERFIVVLRDDVADPGAVANELARRNRGAVGHVYQFALKGFSVQLPPQAVAALARDPRVAFVEQDQLAFAVDVPTGVDRIEVDKKLDFGGTTNPADVSGDIAIIDTGIAPHADLSIAGGANCTGGIFFASCTNGNPGDNNGHGTHVAGTAAANGGVVGVAPGANLYGVKVLDANGSGYISWIVAGIDWVTARADTIDVANMSLGCQCTSTAMNNAITNSTNAGVVYVVAAGNDSMNASNFSPANHPNVIGVSAVADFDGQAGGGAPATCRSDVDDTLADFSNFGSVVDLAAPGVCIRSTWTNGGYNTISGTSMASPHVAGAAALYLIEHPGATWQGVRAGLQSDGWSVPQSDDCGFTEGLSGERFLMLASCDGATDEPPPTNEPPTAAGGSVTTDEDTTVEITLSGSDAETCELFFAIASGPANGSLTGLTGQDCDGTGSPNTDSAAVTYMPNENVNGSDSFTFTVKDASLTSEPATVSITVNPVNDVPVAGDDSATTDQDVAATIAVLANDTDADGDALSVTNLTQPANGSAALNPDGTVTYTPTAGFSGVESFTYTADDGTADSNVATVTVTVNAATPPNDPPTVEIVNPEDGVVVSGPITIQIAATDTEDAANGLPLNVAYSVNGGTPVAAGFNSATGHYEALWDTTSTSDGPYTLTAQATDSANQTAVSAPVGVTVNNPVVLDPPAAPSGLTGTTAPRGRPRVDLSWTDNADNELGFILYRCLGNTTTLDPGSCAAITLQGESSGVGGTVSHRDFDVSRGSSYTYFVVAYNGDGESAPSNGTPVTA